MWLGTLKVFEEHVSPVKTDVKPWLSNTCLFSSKLKVCLEWSFYGQAV